MLPRLNLHVVRAMSLNGLDSAAIAEAYQSALTDAGGWYVPLQIAFLLGRFPIVAPLSLPVISTVHGYGRKIEGFLLRFRR